MRIVVGGHRATNNQFVSNPRCARKQFAEIDPRHICMNRSKQTSNFGRRFRFWIERLMLRSASTQVEVDYVLRSPECRVMHVANFSMRLCRQQSRQRQPQSIQPAHTQQLPAIETVSLRRKLTGQGQHSVTSGLHRISVLRMASCEGTLRMAGPNCGEVNQIKSKGPPINRNDVSKLSAADAVAVRSDKVLYISVALSGNSVLPQFSRRSS